MPHIFCFGYGNCAQALHKRMLGQDWQFSGTGQTDASLSAMASEGVAGHLFDGKTALPDLQAALEGVSHLLISIPPQDAGDPVLQAHGEQLREALPALRWIGYLSTTGVYGDRGGSWVDEATPPAPTSERGMRRLKAENSWVRFAISLNVSLDVSLVRFRLPGLYGPARNPLIACRDGSARRIYKQGHVFSRIHLDDVAQATDLAISLPDFDGCLNVCDDEPATQSDVVAFGCGLLGIDAPALIDFDEAELSSAARSFYSENKRVRNDLMKETLGLKLLYPTYREGLRSLLTEL